MEHLRIDYTNHASLAMPNARAVDVNWVGTVYSNGESICLDAIKSDHLINMDGRLRNTYGWSSVGVDGATPETGRIDWLAGIVGITLGDRMAARIDLEDKLLARSDRQGVWTKGQPVLTDGHCLNGA
jgi:hypothetical protein